MRFAAQREAGEATAALEAGLIAWQSKTGADRVAARHRAVGLVVAHMVAEKASSRAYGKWWACVQAQAAERAMMGGRVAV